MIQALLSYSAHNSTYCKWNANRSILHVALTRIFHLVLSLLTKFGSTHQKMPLYQKFNGLLLLYHRGMYVVGNKLVFLEYINLYVGIPIYYAYVYLRM